MAAFGTTKIAPTKWAQRTDTLYVTLAIADVKDETLNVTEKGVNFKGKSGGTWTLWWIAASTDDIVHIRSLTHAHFHPFILSICHISPC